MIAINHPGISKEWFDAALRRAVEADIRVRLVRPRTIDKPALWEATSASQPTVRYLVTERECSCAGHIRFGRCYHRVDVIFEEQVMGQPAVALPHSDEPLTAA